MVNVLFDLVAIERSQLGVHQDALAKLPQALFGENPFEFRLTHQNDLEQLLLVGFEVGKQTQLFEQFEGEVLRFVNDEENVLSLLDPIKQDVVDLFDEPAATAARSFFAEFRQDGLEQLGFGDARIED